MDGISQANDGSFELKVLTYNIWGWNQPVDKRLEMIAKGIAELDPHLVGLQEVMESPDSDGSDNSAFIIANRLEELTGKKWFLYKQNSHNFGDAVFGFGILSTFPIFQRGYRYIPRGEFNRILQWSQIETPIGFVNFYNTHLSYGDQWETRIEQVKKIKGFIQEDGTTTLHMSTIMCGDFNDRPGTIPITTFTQEDPNAIWFFDTWELMHPGDPGYTVPAWDPSMRIDYVFLRADENGVVKTSQLVFDEPDSSGTYPSDHLGVLSTMEYTVNVFTLQLITPHARDTVSGVVPISWEMSGMTEPVKTTLWVSSDDGQIWAGLFWNEFVTENTYYWDTRSHPDGTQYRLKIYAQGSTEVGMDETGGTFAVNNPGNAIPEIKILSPEEGDVISGEWFVNWSAEDADGDVLTFSTDYSSDNGATWKSLFADLQDTDEFVWDTPSFANGPSYRLVFLCSDDSVVVSDTTGLFEVFNKRAAIIPTQQFYHAQGNSHASIKANVIDPGQLTEDLYRITFNDSHYSHMIYGVFNMDTGEKVVENAKELDGVTEGPLFDGMRLVIEDLEQAEIDYGGSGWAVGTSTLELTVYLPVIHSGSEVIEGYPYPADYGITIFDHIVDTSVSAYGASEIPMMFTVWNLTEEKESDVLFVDADNDHTISRLDEIFILEPSDHDGFQLTWAIFFGGRPDATLPQPGDEFVFKTFKPLSGDDGYEFRATLTPVELARIEVTPGSVHLLLNEQQQFSAAGYGMDGLPIIPPVTPVWSTDGGTISANGLYTATIPGDFIVTVSVIGSSVTGEATVHVNSCAVLGDVNCDGHVDMADVVSTVNFILGLDPSPFDASCADYNGDGQVDILDVILIIQIILGK